MATPKPVETWSDRNRRLVNSGSIDIWVDRTLLETGRGPTRGRPYLETLIHMCLIIGVVYHLPLRQTEGFCRSLLGLLQPKAEVPDYTTLCRRRRDLDVTLTPGPTQVLVVDATGLSLTDRSKWFELRTDPRRGRYVKLHIGVNQATARIEAAVVTESSGPGTGDVSVGPDLIESVGPTGAVMGDSAYDSLKCYQAAFDVGATLVTVPKSTARRGLHPDRDRTLTQIDRIGLPRWKKIVGYGQRSQVESVNSVLKRRVGEVLRGRSFGVQRVEALLKVVVYNRMLEC